MRRNKGLLITVIIIIILLVIALISLVLVKFVFNKDTKKPNNQGQNVSEPPSEPEKQNIKIGDYIAYVPDKSEKYIVEGTTSGAANNSRDGIKQETLNWRVLNINEDGSIDIISEEPTTAEVYFGGALGYNNGTYLLNDICEMLYSNKNLKSKARSINLEDIEGKMTDTALAAREEYENNGIAYGDTETFEGNNAYVPEIYTKKPETESTDYYTLPTTGTFMPQEEVSIQSTFYSMGGITEEYVEDEIFYELIFETESEFWLATRCIDCSSDSAIFGLRKINQDEITGASMCSSSNRSGSSKSYIRPVVTLSKNIETSGTGTQDDPITIAGGNSETTEGLAKINEDNEWIYDAEYTKKDLEGKSYKSSVTTETYSLEDIKVPFINIDSEDANEANEELKKLFDQAVKLFEEELDGDQASYVLVSYEKVVNDEYLSVLVKTEVGGEEEIPNSVYYTYNFDMNTGNKLTYDEVYDIVGISEDEIEEKAEEAITEEFKYRFKGLAEGYESDLEEYSEKTVEDYKETVSDETIKYFIDEYEKLNIISNFKIPTGRENYEIIVTIE